MILGHELKVNKKINDSLYRKIQLSTYSRTTEQKLKRVYKTLNDIENNMAGIFCIHARFFRKISTIFRKPHDIFPQTYEFTRVFLKTLRSDYRNLGPDLPYPKNVPIFYL